MKTAKQEQIWDYIIELISDADDDYLKRADSPSKLIEELSNELLFVGVYTREELDSLVIPYMKENAMDIYLQREYALKNETATIEVPITFKEEIVRSAKEIVLKIEGSTMKSVFRKKTAARKRPAKKKACGTKKKAVARKKPARKKKRKRI